MSRTVLVAGVGNIFLTDDGFGVEVANRLAEEVFPSGVRVADFGIRGVHLAYELLEGYDGLILVDAVDLRDAPGTISLIEPERVPSPGAFEEEAPAVDAHSMSPEIVLGTLARLGGSVDQVYVIGCQPESLDEGMGLTGSVAAAVDEAVQLCTQLVADMMGPLRKGVRA